MNESLKPAIKFNRLTWLLYAVLALVCGIIVTIATLDYHTDSALRQITHDEVSNRELYATIMQLDEVLTMSARMAAATGDKQWEERYQHYDPILDGAIKKAIDLYPDEYSRAGAKRIDEANQKLVDMEKRVLALAHGGRRQEATDIINSNEYDKQKSIYAEGMKQFITTTLGNSERVLDNFSEEIYGRLLLLLSAFVLLIVGVFVFRQGRALLAYQVGVEVELIQSRDHLRESEVLFRTVTSNLPNMVYMTDTSKANVFFNKTWSDYTRRPVEQDMGFGWAEVTHPDDIDAVKSIYFDAFDKRKTFGVEMRIKHHSGNYHLFYCTGVPRYDEHGDFAGYIGSLVDITDRKKMEEELRLHRDNLQTLVNEQTHSLRLAKEEAERANRLKSEFLANVTHELKTPVHCIVNFAQLGGREADNEKTASMKEYFEDIFTNGMRLDNLISDLLDFSKIEAGNMDFFLDMHPISTLVENAIAATRGMYEEKNLHVNVVHQNMNEQIIVDARRIEQVLVNLMSNAIRFSPEGGQIIWRFTPATMQICDSNIVTPAITVTIEDEGPGIPKDEVERIFDHFVQGKEAILKGGGTGLGLAICRQILQTFHGTIRADNVSKGGAAFEIVLPLWHKLSLTTTHERNHNHA